MFRKLIKHEFAASVRILLPLWVLLILLSAMVTGLTYAVRMTDLTPVAVFHTFVCIIFVLGCFALSVMAFAFMIIRFYRSVLSDSGYLTNTLPVSAHGIVCSRFVCALLSFVLTGTAILLSGIIALSSSGFIREALQELKTIIGAQTIEQFLKDFSTSGILVIVNAVMSIVLMCMRCYAAMSIGHSISDHKKALSFVFYFVFGMAEQIVISFVLKTSLSALTVDAAARLVNSMTLTGIISSIVFSLIYYFTTVFFISKKLNLD